MKTLLRRSLLLLALIAAILTQLAMPALADSTADLILNLKCPSEYTVNVWQKQPN